ncbi:YhbY family RNA-binding protein [Oceanobacter kriegii]|uniref:YhbY family RNA-binding protein n=1 Tax=Oceanobacter kriegii TaxID=64972 RepID=UPI00041E480B|nr:YhbY family RNA-binding protein [Oceanobacter kriegii]
MPLSNDEKKAYRSIGHKLNPIVTVASNGLTEAVLDELNRALDDHELIKIKIAVGDRELKKEAVEDVVESTGAILVQQIGNTALLLRRNPKAKANLSNLQRF